MSTTSLRLCAVRETTEQPAGREEAAVVHPHRGVALVRDLLPAFAGDLLEVLADDRLGELERAAERAGDSVFRDPGSVGYGPPYRRPRMIWGIGLNYVEHASDLTESVPDEPASFIKGDHTVVGPGENIPVPAQSERTTTEAEIALVIGRYCRDVEPEHALDHVAGIVPVLDQTAEDILQRNPRFLTRSKNFPGFFSFGPQIVALPEVAQRAGSLEQVEVSTVVNGEVRRSNTVAHMRYDPAFLVSFHSKVMPLYPGDIISTGTPGAVHIRPGDVAECRVAGLATLRNPVTGAV